MWDLTRIPQQRDNQSLKRDGAVRAHGDQRRMGQLPLGRVGDDAQRRERNPAIGGDLRGDMRFHVHRMGAGLKMEITLAGTAGDRRVNPCEINERRTERFGQSPRPGGIGVNPLAISADDRARDQNSAGREAGREASGDAEADDGASFRCGGFFQLALQARAVAPARYDMNLRPRCEPGLRLEAGNGDDAPPRRMRV